MVIVEFFAWIHWTEECCHWTDACHDMEMFFISLALCEGNHDDVIKWKHFPHYWPFVRGIHRSPVNSPHKGQWPGALIFTLICARINGWVNNREAGDLRRHRAHYDVTVMIPDGFPHKGSVLQNFDVSFNDHLKQPVEQSAELWVIWDAMTLISCHCNVSWDWFIQPYFYYTGLIRIFLSQWLNIYWYKESKLVMLITKYLGI